MPLTVGSRIAHYDVTALIGEGGMGQVYQATDTKLNRQVALKILPEAFATDPDRLARFQREAQVLASLNHPGIAAIYGLEESDGTRALVLELVEGPTLADRIAKGPIPVDEALPIAKQIAEALEAAHEAGVIHRDLKPANIKVREDGTVKVLDFGLAKALDTTPQGDPSQSPTLTAAATQMGVIMGTLAYMSPEQARGRTVDKRADIWSFGVVLYEMLTGKRLFQGDDVSLTLAKVLEKEPTWEALPSAAPPRMATLLRRCLQKDPKQRLADMQDVRLAMEGAFETTGGAPSEPIVAPSLHVWQRPAVVALAVIGAALVTGVAVWSARPEEPRPVSRMSYQVPGGQQFRNPARRVLAVSPDGRRFAYETPNGLYLRSMDSFEPQVLLGDGAGIRLPVFSPDGQSIDYFERPGVLKQLALGGGAPLVITDGVSGPGSASWASDGTIFCCPTARR